MYKYIGLIVTLISTFSLMFGETILFMGDSITDGNWGSPQKYPCPTEERNLWDQNHILGHGYVEMLAGYFMGTYPEKDFKFLNRGISGETLSQIAARWEKDCINNHPDIVNVLCGTNDVHYWLEQNPSSLDEFDFNSYKNTLDSLILKTLQYRPQTKIVLCTPFVANVGRIGESKDYTLRKAAVDKLADIIKESVAELNSDNLILIDFNDLVNQLAQEKSDMSYWIWDGIHPTTAMHFRMAHEWKSKVNL